MFFVEFFALVVGATSSKLASSTADKWRLGHRNTNLLHNLYCTTCINKKTLVLVIRNFFTFQWFCFE